MRHIRPVGKPASAQTDPLQAIFNLILCLFGSEDPLFCLEYFIKDLLGL